MLQGDFKQWKGHLDRKYRTEKKDTEGNQWYLRKVHWLNFDWGEQEDGETGEMVLCHHPGEVWMRESFSREEPWRKVRIHTRENHDTTPTQLYTQAIKLKPAKVKDLKAMADKYIPAPQKHYYINLQADEEAEDSE